MSKGTILRIVDVQVYSVAVPRIYRTFVAPAGGHAVEGKETSRYLLFELIGDNGTIGLGEISDIEESWKPPTPSELRELLAATLYGQDVANRNAMWDVFCESIPADTHLELRRLMTASVEMALLDLAGKQYGVPLYELLGGRCREALLVSWVIYIRGTEDMEREVQEKVNEGFTAFKMKVGEDFDLDCERVRLFRRIAPDPYLKADASGEWEEDEAIEKICRLAELGVDAVETPVRAVARSVAKEKTHQVNDAPHEAAKSLARIRDAVPIQIIEHVSDFDEAFALALTRHRAVDVFNVVPCQAGSIRKAQRLIHLAEAAGIQALLGSTVELGVGTAAALHLGLASKGVTVASDLIGPGLMSDDVTSPRFEFESGHLRAPEAPGLGVSLDPEKLERYGIETSG